MTDLYDDPAWGEVVRLGVLPEFAGVECLGEEGETLFNKTAEGRINIEVGLLLGFTTGKESHQEY